MLILLLSTVLIGRDRFARMYMGIAGRAAEEFALSQRAAKRHGNGPSPDRDRIISNALWGIFNAVTCGSLGCERYPALTVLLGYKTSPS